jgi:hypothetical protein
VRNLRQHSQRVSRGRTASYDRWLAQQQPEYRRALIAAEERYLRDVNDPLGHTVAVAKDYGASLRGSVPSVAAALTPRPRRDSSRGVAQLLLGD